MKYSNAIKTAAVITIITSGTTYANELKINPGLWKTKTSTSMPFTDKPMVQENEECISVGDSVITIDKIKKDTKGECKPLDSSFKGDTLTIVMSCKSDGVESMVNGKVVASGNTNKGEMNFNMKVNGQSYDMKMSWEGQRIGECPAGS